MNNFLSALVFRRTARISSRISREELDARAGAFPFAPGSLKHIPYKELGYLVAPHINGGWMISRDYEGGWRTALVAAAESSTWALAEATEGSVQHIELHIRFHRTALLFLAAFLVLLLGSSIYQLFKGHYNSFKEMIGFLLFFYLLNIWIFLAAALKMERWVREVFLHPQQRAQNAK